MNTHPAKLVHVLVTDDDEDDQLLIREAFEDGKLKNPVSFFSNGRELLTYLKREMNANGTFRSGSYLVLLDLNMPVMDGRETLEILKQSDHFRKIPVVVLTTSRADEDIVQSYESGVNSYISKPVTFDGLVEVLRMLQKYWLHMVEVPNA